MVNYEQELEKRRIAVEKYKNLDLKDFLKQTLIECGYDLSHLDNVYIGEMVELPNVWGCLKQDGKFIAYFTDDRAKVDYKIYDDPYGFFNVFMTCSSTYSKYENSSKNLQL